MTSAAKRKGDKAELEAANTRSRTKPCKRCGGPKDRGLRGAQYCKACHADLQPVWQRQERERSVLKGHRQRREAGIPKRNKKINDEGQVWCNRCASYLPPGRFVITGKGRPAGYCKSCNKAYNHEQRLKKVFGITVDDYNRMLDIQGGRCAICRCRPNRARLAVDHNHVTGKIRGLLCKRCNHDLLGAAQESVEVLERAICYLESPPADTGLPVVVHEDFERNAIFLRPFEGTWIAVMELDELIPLLAKAINRSTDGVVMDLDQLAALLREATAEENARG